MSAARAAAVLAAAALSSPATGRADPQGPAPLDLAGFSRGLEALVERVRPAVVQVLVTGYAPDQSALLTRQRSTGSGVILDPAGYVVTNAHVVEGARRVRVVLAGPPAEPSEPRSVLKARGRTLGAQVVGVDRETDLAVLKVAEEGLPSLPLGDSEALRQGQIVLAFGSPLGLENSVTLGVVSAVARQVGLDDPMIHVQTDASINPGNSGGPLVDGSGRVVGINTFILSQSGGHEGIGFAAPSNIVRNVFEQIRRTGRVRRGEIGVRAQTITPALAAGLRLPRDWGVVLSDVRPGGPGAAGGLAMGDVVVSLDSKPMENARQLEVNLYRRAPGEELSVEVLRGGAPRTLRVTVAEREGDPARFADLVTPERNVVARLGVLALDLDDRIARMLPPLRARAGVVVAAGASDAAPSSDPLLPGDVIYALNGESVTSLPGLRRLLDVLTPGSPAVLQVERRGELRYLALEIE